MNVSKFAKNNIGLCIGTFGLALVGYMGYLAIRKCCKANKTQALFQKKTWWESVTETKDFTRFKRNWKHIAKSDAARQRQAAKLRSAYYYKNPPSSNDQAPLGTIYNVPGTFSFWMPGVALVAAYLAEKKKVEGLFVCQTLEALAKKIQEISQNPQDQKVALVVGAFPSGFKLRPNFPQHKVAVLVERKEGQLSIALLDSVKKRLIPSTFKKRFGRDMTN